MLGGSLLRAGEAEPGREGQSMLRKPWLGAEDRESGMEGLHTLGVLVLQAGEGQPSVEGWAMPKKRELGARWGEPVTERLNMPRDPQLKKKETQMGRSAARPETLSWDPAWETEGWEPTSLVLRLKESQQGRNFKINDKGTRSLMLQKQQGTDYLYLFLEVLP